MHPTGCFGSSLAYREGSNACMACDARQECSKIVEDRHPMMMKLLAQFSDGKGDTMAKAWRNKTDKAAEAEAKRRHDIKNDKVLRIIVSLLMIKPQKTKELIEAVANELSIPTTTARDKVYKQIKFLRSRNILKPTKPLELQCHIFPS